MSVKYLNIIFIFIIAGYISVSAAEELTWYNYKDGVELAKKDSKYLLIDFYTDWCGWCKKMDSETYDNRDIIKIIEEHFVPVKLNPEKNGPISFQGQLVEASTFSHSAGVSGYPATGFFTSNMQYINTTPGYLPPDKFKELLLFIVNESYKKMSFQDYSVFNKFKELSKSMPDNPDVNFVLGFLYQKSLKEYNTAQNYYSKALKADSSLIESYSLLEEIAIEQGDKKSAEKYKAIYTKDKSYTPESLSNRLKSIAQKYLQ